MIEKYDIIAVQETKLDDIDHIEIKGCTVFDANGREFSNYRSGG